MKSSEKRTPVRLTEYLAALSCMLVLSSSVLAQQKNGSVISISADERGTTTVGYAIWLDKPLAPSQAQALESALGVALDGPEPFDDGDDDDDAGRSTPDGPLHKAYLYHAKNGLALSRTGFRFEGDLDLKSVAAALKTGGVWEAVVTMSLPKKVDPAAEVSSGRSVRAIRNFAYSARRLDLTAADPGLVLHIAFGDPGPDPSCRLSALLVLLIAVIALVLWLQRLALREAEEGNPGPSLAHTRFNTLMSLVLPVTWWMTFSLVDFRKLAHYRLGFGPVLERVLVEGLIGIGLPCLIFWICALIWRPIWRAIPLPPPKPGQNSQSPVDLFLGLFLPMLLILGSLFYLFEARPEVLAVLLLAALASLALRARLSPVKSPAMQLHVLLAPELRQRVFELASRAKVKLDEVFILADSGHRLSNAFAASNNTVWISEYLLRRLSRAEVDAIVAHEIGHLKRRHPLLRTAAASGGLTAGLMLAFFLREMDNPPDHMNLLFPASVALSIVLFLFVARRMEFSADLWSLKLNSDPEAMITGLVRVSYDGRLPLNWSKWDEKLLSHPSTVRRAARLAAKSGITKERLDQLLSVSAEPGECYSLAPGPASVLAPASGVTPEAMPQANKKSKKRINYRTLPLIRGLTAFYMALALSVFGPQQIGVVRHLYITVAVCGSVSAILIGMLVFYFSARSLKRRVSRGLTTPFTVTTTAPDQLLGVDVESVRACTAELESLGFHATGDYCIEVPGAPDLLKQFWRVSASRENSCWAQLSQIVTDTLGVSKVSCTFVSDLGNGFALYTSNSEPAAILCAARMPREIRIHVPGASLTDLLRIHLAQGNSITSSTGLVPLQVTTADGYLVYELERAADRRRTIKRRNSWLFLRRVDKFNRKPKMEWAGRDKRIKKCLSHPQRAVESQVQPA